MPVVPTGYICLPCNERFTQELSYYMHLTENSCTVPRPRSPNQFKQRLHQHGAFGAVFTYKGRNDSGAGVNTQLLRV